MALPHSFQDDKKSWSIKCWKAAWTPFQPFVEFWKTTKNIRLTHLRKPAVDLKLPSWRFWVTGNLLVYLKLTSYLKNRGCVCISPPDVAGMLPSRGSRPNSMPPSNIDSKVPTQSDTHGRPSSGLSNLGQTGWCFKWIEMEELVRVASGMWSGVWWSHPACSGPSPEAKENST